MSLCLFFTITVQNGKFHKTGDFFIPGRRQSVGTMPVMPGGRLGVRRFISAFKSRVSFIFELCIATRTGRAARRVTTFERKNMQGARRVVSAGPPACGWLRGTSRTSPRTPSPVAGAGPIAKHFRSRARLRRLLVRLRRPTPSTPALRATPGGASLTTFGFVTTVPRYLPVASNSLTFVRGADRAYCAPRKWLWRPTFALQKLAAARPPEGHWRAHPAAVSCRPPHLLCAV